MQNVDFIYYIFLYIISALILLLANPFPLFSYLFLASNFFAFTSGPLFPTLCLFASSSNTYEFFFFFSFKDNSTLCMQEPKGLAHDKFRICSTKYGSELILTTPSTKILIINSTHVERIHQIVDIKKHGNIYRAPVMNIHF